MVEKYMVIGDMFVVVDNISSDGYCSCIYHSQWYPDENFVVLI